MSARIITNINMGSNTLRWIALAVAIVVLVLHNAAISPWMLDDSFISFRYAENLGSGNGPVYNAGERVEGYTCFLWVVLLAPGKLLGIATPDWSKILGAVFAVATLLTLWSARRFVPSLPEETSAYAVLLLGTCAIFTPWASSGMEVCFFTFLAALVCLRHLQLLESPRLSGAAGQGILLALLAMTRPEGLLFVALLILHAGIAGPRKQALWTVLFFALPYVPYFLWRWSYYGYLLPNTFYAKVGSHASQLFRGIRYLVRFLIAGLFLCIFAARGTWGAPRLRVLGVVAAAYTAYVVVVGGDIMPAFRFFTPVLPLLCLLAAADVAQRKAASAQGIVLILALAGYNLLQMSINPSIQEAIATDTVALDGKEAGEFLKTRAPEGAVIATNTGGSVPYYSGLRALDMLGLNDAHIAHRQIPWLGSGPAGHEKGDGAYVLSRAPDYIQFGSSLGSAVPLFLSDQEMFRMPQFAAQYQLTSFRLPSGKELLLYVRKQAKP